MTAKAAIWSKEKNANWTNSKLRRQSTETIEIENVLNNGAHFLGDVRLATLMTYRCSGKNAFSSDYIEYKWQRNANEN